MLFNSPEFIFAFLPASLLLVGLCARFLGPTGGILALSAASMFFYAWWMPAGIAIICVSICVNFVVSRVLAGGGFGRPLMILWLGIAANITAIGYFKYTNFALSIFGLPPHNIALPLAISFFTFQQIAFLVDIYRGQMGSPTLRDYAVSVVFFPHLIAGPLIHYTDIMRQFRFRFAVNTQTLATGLPIFCVGLAKKVGLADNLAAIATPLFKQAESGTLEFFSAWTAALSYTMQIYFDFSGYSDMAIGLGLMFGIVLPINFNSPYKSISIIDFWRRWHMTLSAFLRDYLYFPLGGGRIGQWRRYINLMLVMLIGGLWHGAGWTFIFWGFLHGVYLCVNHLWNAAESQVPKLLCKLISSCGGVLTFAAVVVGWVFFRAADFSAATSVLNGMIGASHASLAGEVSYFLGVAHIGAVQFDGRGLTFSDEATAIFFNGVAMSIVFFSPNTAEIFGLKDTRRILPAEEFGYRPLTWRSAVAAALCLWIAGFGVIGSAPSQFIYFRF